MEPEKVAPEAISEERLTMRYEDVTQADADAAEQYAMAYICGVGVSKEAMVDAVSTLRALTVAYDRELLAARQKIAELEDANKHLHEISADYDKIVLELPLIREQEREAGRASLEQQLAALKASHTAEKAAAHEAGFAEAREYLKDYFAKHRMGVKDVVQSQWARGVHSGRQEAINVLNDAPKAIRGMEKIDEDNGRTS